MIWTYQTPVEYACGLNQHDAFFIERNVHGDSVGWYPVHIVFHGNKKDFNYLHTDWSLSMTLRDGKIVYLDFAHNDPRVRVALTDLEWNEMIADPLKFLLAYIL